MLRIAFSVKTHGALLTIVFALAMEKMRLHPQTEILELHTGVLHNLWTGEKVCLTGPADAGSSWCLSFSEEGHGILKAGDQVKWAQKCLRHAVMIDQDGSVNVASKQDGGGRQVISLEKFKQVHHNVVVEFNLNAGKVEFDVAHFPHSTNGSRYWWSLWSLSAALGHQGTAISKYYQKRWGVWKKYIHSILPEGHAREPLAATNSPSATTLVSPEQVLPFFSVSTHGWLAILIRGIASPEGMGGCIDDKTLKGFEQILAAMVTETTSKCEWLVFTESHRRTLANGVIGDGPVRMEIQDGQILVDEALASPAGCAAQAKATQAGKGLFMKKVTVMEFVKWCHRFWVPMYIQMVWHLGDALECELDSIQKLGDSQENVAKRIKRGISVKDVDWNFDSDRGRATFMHVSMQAMQQHFHLADKLSCCADFGRTGSKNRMVSAFAVPSGEAEWAPQQDPQIPRTCPTPLIGKPTWVP